MAQIVLQTVKIIKWVVNTYTLYYNEIEAIAIRYALQCNY